MKPNILLATTCRWFAAARLAMAFSEAGCSVEMVFPRGHPATKTTALRRGYSFHGLDPTTSLYAAIDRAQPDLIIPCDDLCTIYLHQLYLSLVKTGKAGKRSTEVLRRSLGPQTCFPTLEARSKLMALARSLGVRTPETAVVTKDTLRPWLITNGIPAVLKADGSAGGRGVQVVRTMAMAEQAFAELSTPPFALRAVKRALFDQDRTLLKPSIHRTVPVVNAQVLVSGRDATTSVACWEGEVVAAISVEVIRKETQEGPSSVVRLIDHPEMSQSAERIVKELSLSGLFGFDFILGEHNNCATLIEMNARATQICHLALGTHHDLPVALSAVVGGKPIPATKPVTELDVIALFPQEWHSDPASEYLATAYHDVPWREPRLVKACVDFYFARKRWYSPQRLVKLYRKVSTSAFHRHPIKLVGRP